MQARRDQYLKSMGIQVWRLRDNPSVVIPDSPAETVEDFPSIHGSATMANEQQKETFSAGQTSLPVADPQPSQAVSASETHTSLTPSSDVPEFRFASIVFPGICVVVTEVPLQVAAPIGSQQLAYLKNLLLAIDQVPLEEPQITLFNWPMLRGANFDQSETAAQEASQAFLRAQKARHSVGFVLLMGEEAGRYLLPNATGVNTDKGCLYQSAEETILLTESVEAVFADAQLKADVWAHLQPLLGL